MKHYKKIYIILYLLTIVYSCRQKCDTNNANETCCETNTNSQEKSGDNYIEYSYEAIDSQKEENTQKEQKYIKKYKKAKKKKQIKKNKKKQKNKHGKENKTRRNHAKKARIRGEKEENKIYKGEVCEKECAYSCPRFGVSFGMGGVPAWDWPGYYYNRPRFWGMGPWYGPWNIAPPYSFAPYVGFQWSV